MMPVLLATFAAAGLGAWGAGEAAAQFPSADARAYGLGGNGVAVFRDLAAATWNPAGLAAEDRPRWAVAALPLQVSFQLGPVGLRELWGVRGEEVSHAVRSRWLDRIRAQGSQRVRAGFDLVYGAATVGPFSVQLSRSGRTAAALPTDAATLLLFGNAGPTGEPEELGLRGLRLEHAELRTLTLAGAHGTVLGSGEDRTWIAGGVAARLTKGERLLGVKDDGSYVLAEPLVISLSLPVLELAHAPGELLRGVAVDAGMQLQWRRFMAGVAAHGLVDGFGWVPETGVHRPGRVALDGKVVVAEVDEEPVDGAPPAVRQRARDLAFRGRPPRRLAAGLGWQATPELLVVGDLSRTTGGPLLAEPGVRAGVGLEHTPGSGIVFRTGGTRGAEDATLAAGGRVSWRGVDLDTAGELRWTGLGRGHRWVATLAWRGR